MEVFFNGRSVDTKFFDGHLDTENIKGIRNNYYSVTKEQALEQLKNVLLNGKVRTQNIYGYYFEKIANDGILYHSKFSINEVLESDELIQIFLNKVKASPKVFSSPSLVKNFKTAIRLGGKGIAAKLTNFPFKECKRVLSEYADKNISNIYIDPCCGWGIRMLASATLDLNYIGFDINPLLVEKLKELGKDIQKIKPNWRFRIVYKGSENFVQNLVGSASLVFTSPPYYNLEDYVNIEDVEENPDNISYQQWLDDFVTPMLKNSFTYLRNGGKLLMNVKNFKDYPIFEDFQRIGNSIFGLKALPLDTLKNNTRVGGSRNKHELNKIGNDEHILVWRKEE